MDAGPILGIYFIGFYLFLLFGFVRGILWRIKTRGWLFAIILGWIYAAIAAFLIALFWPLVAATYILYGRGPRLI